MRSSRERLSELEADLAFFEARLSLAGEAPDTAYQRAQIKTYRTLGLLFGNTLSRVQSNKDKAAKSKASVD